MANDSEAMVVVASSPQDVTMQLMKSYLEEHGLFATVLDVHVAAQEAPMLGESRLQVRASDESQARALLTEYEARLNAPLGGVFPWVKKMKG
jgi:Tfp pilus assembly PilM family ATPase